MWNESYDITANELSQIMELCRDGYVCTKYEPGETLFIVFEKENANGDLIDTKEFEFTKC